jgi:hypothetical protein
LTPTIIELSGQYDPDIHAVTLAATQPKRLYASTAREVFISSDLGESWQALGIREKWPLPYARGMAVKADDPGVLFAGCGETTTGETGYVLRTANFGETWEVLRLPTQPNATVWGLATHPAAANRIVAFSLFGEVYVTENAGGPGARSGANSARSGPQSGCQTNASSPDWMRVQAL